MRLQGQQSNTSVACAGLFAAGGGGTTPDSFSVRFILVYLELGEKAPI